MDLCPYKAKTAEHSSVAFTTTGDNYGYQSTIHNEYTTIQLSGPEPQKSAKEIAEASHEQKQKKRMKYEGTCDWLLEKDDFKAWSDEENECSALWLQGNFGYGKSMLLSRVIDWLNNHGKKRQIHLLYFYIDFENNQRKFMQNLLSAFCEQISPEELPEPLKRCIEKRPISQEDLLEALKGGIEKWHIDQMTGKDLLQTLKRGIEKRPIDRVSPEDLFETLKRVVEKWSIDQIIREDLLEKLKRCIERRHVDKQRALFEFLAETERPVYIVVDALDQLNDKNRTQLLKAFDHLLTQCQTSQGRSRVMLLVSSRDDRGLHELQAHKHRSIKVEAKDNANDIEVYLEKKLETNLLCGRPHLERGNAKMQVLSKLTKHASGMFLWVKLQAMSICANTTEAGVLDDLDNLTLPDEMDEMYKKIAQGFEVDVRANPGQRTTENEKEIARRTIALLAHATRPIPQGALVVAVALKTNDGNSNEDLVTELKTYPSIIVQACKHLVELDEELGVFRFCHASVYDFFRGYDPCKTHFRVAMLSLSHLCSSEFSRGPFGDASSFDPGPLEPFLQRHPFLEFASCHWAHSTRKSAEEDQEQLQGLIVKLCEKPKNMQLSFQVYLFTLKRSFTAETCHAHILSHFGLVRFFKMFHARGWLDPRRRDGDGLTALHWAIRSETETIDEESETQCTVLALGKLIKYGGQKDAQDNKERTPLYYASRYGKVNAVKLLLKKNAKVNIRSERYGPALLVACYNHHEPIIRELLDAGADVNINSTFGTPLHAVASIGCRNCAELLLEKRGFFRSPRLNIYGGYFGTALHVAAYNGHPDVVKLLLEKGFDVGKMSKNHGSTLTAAASGCYEALDPSRFVQVFRLLFKYRVDVNAQGGIHGTALHAAATFGHEVLVKLLLEQNADVTATGKIGTAYLAAKDGGYDNIMKMLAEKDPKVANEDGYTYNRPLTSDAPNKSLEAPLPQYWVRLFKLAVAANDRPRIASMIWMATGVFERSIKEDQNNVVAGLASVAEAMFEAVISRATKGKAGKTERPDPYILDQLTQAVVAIMECALANNNSGAVTVLADILTQALYKIMSRGEFGKRTLENIVHNRAIQLRGIMSNDQLRPHQRLEKAKRLAEVGVELRVTAQRRGRDNEAYRVLAISLAKLWVSPLEDVLHQGERCQAEVRQLVETFAQKFQTAVDKTDKENVCKTADIAIEMLKMTALSRSDALMEVLATMCADKWAAAIRRKVLKSQIDRLIEGRAEEYRECINRKSRDEALGLAAAFMGLLDAAISRNFEAMSQMLINTITTELEWTVHTTNILEDTRDVDSTNDSSKSQSQPLDLMVLFDSFAKIITVAKRESRLTNLDGMVRAVLRVFDSIPRSISKTLNDFMGQRLQMPQHQDEPENQAKRSDPRLELRLEQSSTAVATLLHMALQGHTVPAALTNMGITLLGEIRMKGNTEQDTEVIRFLEEQNNGKATIATA